MGGFIAAAPDVGSITMSGTLVVLAGDVVAVVVEIAVVFRPVGGSCAAPDSCFSSFRFDFLFRLKIDLNGAVADDEPLPPLVVLPVFDAIIWAVDKSSLHAKGVAL